MVADQVISVLAVDCEVGCESDSRLLVTRADSSRSAIEALRMMRFDLMVSTTAIAGEPIWVLAAKVKALRPKLRWLLVAPELSAHDEQLARSLGVSSIVESMPSIECLCGVSHGQLKQEVSAIEQECLLERSLSYASALSQRSWSSRPQHQSRLQPPITTRRLTDGLSRDTR